MHGCKMPTTSVPRRTRPVQGKKRIYAGAESRAIVSSGENKAHKYRGEIQKLSFGGLRYSPAYSVEEMAKKAV